MKFIYLGELTIITYKHWIIYINTLLGDDRNVLRVFVAGKEISLT